MSEAWVVNASPLILFSRIGRLDLIERLAPTLLVPNAVVEETRASFDYARPLVKELIAAGMLLDDEFADRALATVGE